MKTAQKMSTLKHSEVFEPFNSLELGRLQGILEELTLPKHHMIFAPGMPSSEIYFIEKGRVRVTKLSGAGKSVTLALLGPGDLIGAAAWEADEHNSYAETVDQSIIYQISRDVLHMFILKNPELALRLLAIMSARLKQAQERIEDLVFRPVPSRVARFLIGLSENYGRVTRHGIRIDFPVTHQEIADLVGASRVTVTQTLNQFRTSQWIEIESKQVTIHNLEALEEMVQKE